MLKRKNKKGFTLAELLIVVAIIAVLVAIAVPLFVGALNDAEKRVGEANCRAVRGAAVERILMSNQTDDSAYYTSNELKGPWVATANVGEDGEVSNLTIVVGTALTQKDGTAIGTTGIYNKTDAGYTVQVLITELK